MDTLSLLTRGSGVKFKTNDRSSASLPSSGKAEVKANEIDQGNKKRKRDEYENRQLSEDEVRKIQKSHKIRITDLLALHESKISENRNAQKEKSRIFPQPLQSFSQLRDLYVNSSLVSNVAEQGFHEPTEVQLATIPLLLQTGNEEPDLLTVAPTGSGKTLAFLIPLINSINKRHNNNLNNELSSKHVSAVVLAPTKELASQIVNEGRKLAPRTGVRITAFRKGMKLHEEISIRDTQESSASDDDGDPEVEKEDLSQPLVKADILVATPLSLLHAISPIERQRLLPLPHVKRLILDEADVLLDPMFREQTLAIWSACSAPDLCTSFWSATIGSNIEELVMKTLETRRQKFKTGKPAPFLRAIIGLKDTSLPTITHKLVYASTEPGKLMGLRQLLHPSSSSASAPLRPPFLVFTQTIERATSLHRELLYDIPSHSSSSSSSSSSISRIAVLHSSLSATQRSTIMTNFRQGKIWILITTDLLSRGVDFRGVNGVVNYDIPTTAASYIHRAGRTGRAGREGGVCVTFYTRDDVKYLKVIANIIAASSSSSSSSSSSADRKVNSATQNVADSASGSGGGGVPSWLLQALPDLTKADRKDLRTRGVGVRRGVKDSDTTKERRIKGKNRIGTSSGYERRAQNRKQGAIEGSRRRKRKEQQEQQLESTSNGYGSSLKQHHDSDAFEGFD